MKREGENGRQQLELLKANIEAAQKAQKSLQLQTSCETAVQSWRTGPSQGSHSKKVQGRETRCSLAWSFQNLQMFSSWGLCSFH